MQKIITIVQLRESIALLETKQTEEGLLLKEQFNKTFESLKPINIIKNTIKELSEAPDLKGDLINTSLGIASGYISKKIAIGSTDNLFKKLLGSLLQIGVTNIVTKNAEGIKSTAMSLINNLFSKKEST